MVVDLNKKILRRKRIMRRRMWKLSANQTRVRFENRVKELVSTEVSDMMKTLKDGC